MYYVYHLINPVVNLPFYVGQTKHPNRREEEHLEPSCNPDSLVSIYINTLLTEGITPKLEVLYKTESKIDALKVEGEAISSYFKKYVIMNVRRPNSPSTPYFDRKTATKEDIIAHCGVNGQYCGYFFGDTICPKCFLHESNRRAKIIINNLSSAETVFVCTIKNKDWTRLYKHLYKIRSNYMGIPKPGDLALVVAEKKPQHKDFCFVETPAASAARLLTMEDNLFPKDFNGNTLDRMASRGWRLS